MSSLKKLFKSQKLFQKYCGKLPNHQKDFAHKIWKDIYSQSYDDDVLFLKIQYKLTKQDIINAQKLSPNLKNYLDNLVEYKKQLICGQNLLKDTINMIDYLKLSEKNNQINYIDNQQIIDNVSNYIEFLRAKKLDHDDYIEYLNLKIDMLKYVIKRL
ncbi:hypothetical protein [Powai lake megavirus]|uniref:Uncharacterized protein n=1 Tax=Powai lake megavirus TaxID=1842663 RepID=A0A167RPE0_9VIRU|nr:hypothetical protein QJ849_gp796 [Powai lake megavirus]ANB50958.1 hypothetical protein [Powai lake megavirus]